KPAARHRAAKKRNARRLEQLVKLKSVYGTIAKHKWSGASRRGSRDFDVADLMEIPGVDELRIRSGDRWSKLEPVLMAVAQHGDLTTKLWARVKNASWPRRRSPRKR